MQAPKLGVRSNPELITSQQDPTVAEAVPETTDQLINWTQPSAKPITNQHFYAGNFLNLPD